MTPKEANVIGGALDEAQSYVVRVSAEDDVGGLTVVEIVIPTAGCAFNIREGGDGAGFGKYGEVVNALDMGWDIELNGNNVLRDGAPAFAPSGYGYGEAAYALNSSASTEDELAAQVDAVIANMASGETKQVVFTLSGYGSFRYIGTIYKRGSTDYMLEGTAFADTRRFIKRCEGGVWETVEWLIPPKSVGVEYRTAELFNNKAVYVKVIDYGSLPNAATKSVKINTEFTEVVELTGIVYGTTGKSYNPIVTGMNGVFSLYAWVYGATGSSTAYTVGMRTLSNLTEYTAKFTLKYTKD